MLLMAEFRIRFINSGNSFVGRSIDWVTNSLMDHVEIVTDAGWYLGARSSGGVKSRPPDYCKPTWERRYAIPCTDEQHKKIMDYAYSKVGTKYNFGDIAGLLFRNRRFNSPSKLICSEFVINAGQLAGGIMLLNVKVPYYSYLVTPEMLHLSPVLSGHCYYKYAA